MVSKTTAKKICSSFCNTKNGEISIIKNSLPLEELKRRIDCSGCNENETNKNLNSNKYFKIDNNKVNLKEDGITIVEEKIKDYNEKIQLYLDFNLDKEIPTEEKKFSFLNRNIKYFPKYQNLIDFIVCYIQLKKSVNENVYINDIENFLNNQEVFSKEISFFFKSLIKYYGKGYGKFFRNNTVLKDIFRIRQDDQIDISTSPFSIINKDIESEKNTIVQTKLDLFNYLFEQNTNEISLDKIQNIMEKNNMENNDGNIKTVLNLENDFFELNENVYIVNMKIHKSEFDNNKSFISQCVWLHPYYEKSIIIIVDFLKMHKLLGSTKIVVKYVNEWLLNHYSLNNTEKKEIKNLLKVCGGLISFLNFDINSSIFKLVKEDGNDYVILQSEPFSDDELKSLYQKYHLKYQSLIQESYADDFLLLNYSYLSLKRNNFDDLNNIILDTFVIYFISCSKNFGVICHIQFLLESIEKYKIPIEKNEFNYLKEWLSKKRHVVARKIEISNVDGNSSEEIIHLSFDKKKIINIRKYNADYDNDDNNNSNSIEENAKDDEFSDSDNINISIDYEKSFENDSDFTEEFSNSDMSNVYILNDKNDVEEINKNRSLNTFSKSDSTLHINNNVLSNQSISPKSNNSSNFQSISPKSNLNVFAPKYTPQNIQKLPPGFEDKINSTSSQNNNDHINRSYSTDFPYTEGIFSPGKFYTSSPSSPIGFDRQINNNYMYNNYSGNKPFIYNDPFNENHYHYNESQYNPSDFNQYNDNSIPYNNYENLYEQTENKVSNESSINGSDNESINKNDDIDIGILTNYEMNNLIDYNTILSEDDNYPLPEIKSILDNACVKFLNNKVFYELYATNIIIDTILNIIILSSIEIMNDDKVHISVCVDFINKYRDDFKDELPEDPINEAYLINYINNQRDEKIYEIKDREYIGFVNNKNYHKSEIIIRSKNEFNENINLLIESIKNPSILKDKVFRQINNYLQYFPIYKDILCSIIEILISEDKMPSDKLGSKIINYKPKGFYNFYYQFLIRASNGIVSFIFETPNHKDLFKRMDVKESTKNGKGSIIVYLEPSILGEVDYVTEIGQIIEKYNSSDDIIVVLIVIFLLSYGEYINKAINRNKVVFLSEIEAYLGNFVAINSSSLISIIEKYKNFDLLEKNRVSFHFSNNNLIVNKNLLEPCEETEQFNSELMLKELLELFILGDKRDILKHNFRRKNTVKEYIEFFPYVDRLKHYITDILSKGCYNHEENIINEIKSRSNKLEFYLISYCIGCAGGLRNILYYEKEFEVYKFQGFTFYKYISQYHNTNEIITQNENIDKEIIDVVNKLLPNENDKKRLKRFETKMSRIVQAIKTNRRQYKSYKLDVHLFGSSQNGLWSNQSDVDLCIFADDENGENASINMLYLAHILRIKGMQDVVPIVNTRIPICKFRDKETGFSCDLSCNNRIPIYNSKLIACYMKFDKRVRDIVMIVKKWAKERCINNSKDKTFSSYTFVLLCISYFQRIDPPVLPNLQDENAFPDLKMFEIDVKVSNKLIYKHKQGFFTEKAKFYDNLREVSRCFVSRNQMSLSELLIGLFKFYGCEYNYKDNFCSIRTNGGFKSYEEDREKNFKRTDFAVEDPFIHRRVVNSNSGKEEKEHIINEFYRAYNILKDNGKLSDIFKNDDIKGIIAKSSA